MFGGVAAVAGIWAELVVVGILVGGIVISGCRWVD